MTAADAAASDAELIDRCRHGDAQAWAALVQRYQRLVYAIVRRFGDDEHAAADVFQTVFARLLQHLHRIDQPERLQAWVVTTARREALLARQRAGRTVSMHRSEGDASPSAGEGEGGGGGWAADWEPADEADGPEARLDTLQQLHALRLGLDRLEDRCRTLLTLLFTDEDERPGYDEIGRRLGIPVGSIGPTRARCLAKLRRLIE